MSFRLQAWPPATSLASRSKGSRRAGAPGAQGELPAPSCPQRLLGRGELYTHSPGTRTRVLAETLFRKRSLEGPHPNTTGRTWGLHPRCPSLEMGQALLQRVLWHPSCSHTGSASGDRAEDHGPREAAGGLAQSRWGTLFTGVTTPSMVRTLLCWIGSKCPKSWETFRDCWQRQTARQTPGRHSGLGGAQAEGAGAIPGLRGAPSGAGDCWLRRGPRWGPGSTQGLA